MIFYVESIECLHQMSWSVLLPSKPDNCGRLIEFLVFLVVCTPWLAAECPIVSHRCRLTIPAEHVPSCCLTINKNLWNISPPSDLLLLNRCRQNVQLWSSSMASWRLRPTQIQFSYSFVVFVLFDFVCGLFNARLLSNLMDACTLMQALVYNLQFNGHFCCLSPI